MDPRPGLDKLCCQNPDCKRYGRYGGGNLTVRKVYGADRIRYLRCTSCTEEFSERRGSALFGCKIAEKKACSVIEHIDSGCSLRATASLVGVCREAVSRLVRRTGKVSEKAHDLLVQDIKPVALQFDEKWSYVGKKQKNLKTTDDPDEVGDRWDMICIDPQSKLLISLMPGKRTAASIGQVVADAASRLSAFYLPPALFTDGEETYLEAIRQAFGHSYPAPKTGNRGRNPAKIKRIPHRLVYAKIIKHRKKGKLVHIEISPVFGKARLAGVLALLGWNTPNMSAIERFNLTDRSRNRRKTRKSLGASRKDRYHDAVSWIEALRYNFYHSHRSLRLPCNQGKRKWLRRTPAMAAGLADHPYSTLELLRLTPNGMG